MSVEGTIHKPKRSTVPDNVATGYVREWVGSDGILRTTDEFGTTIIHTPGGTSVAAHEAATDPHPQYTTASEASDAAPGQSVAGKTGTVTLVKADVGLANVDNTSDVNKPVSTATSTAIGAAITAHEAASDPHPTYTTTAEASAAAPVQSVNTYTGAVVLTKSDVGLGNVDNTSDVNKPVSTATTTAIGAAITAHTSALDPHPSYLTQTEGDALYSGISHVHAASAVTVTPSGNLASTNTQAALVELQTDIDARILTSSKGVANGVASLDGTGKVPSAQLPSFVDDVLEFANLASFPGSGSTGVIYVDLATGKIYRWSGSAYVEISASPGSTDAVPEGTTNLYFTNPRAAAAAPVQSVAGKTGTVSLVKADVGLGNVDNTSDANKPVSTAQATAISTAITNHNADLDPHPQYTTTLEAAAAAPVQSVNTYTGAVVLTKSDVGLGNVDNTSDVNKPVSTAQATAISAAITAHNAAADPHPTYTTAAEVPPLVLNTALTGLVTGTETEIVSTDTILEALANLQAQINVWTELITTSDIIVNSNVTLTQVPALGFSAVAGNFYYLEYTVIYRCATTTTGIALTVGTSDTAAGTLALQVNAPITADGTAALYTGSITALDDVVTTTGVQTAQPTWFIANMKGSFNCTTSGTLVPKFRSEVNGSNVNFGTNSIALIRTFA